MQIVTTFRTRSLPSDEPLFALTAEQVAQVLTWFRIAENETTLPVREMSLAAQLAEFAQVEFV